MEDCDIKHLCYSQLQHTEYSMHSLKNLLNLVYFRAVFLTKDAL